jgi:hypothetical protein
MPSEQPTRKASTGMKFALVTRFYELQHHKAAQYAYLEVIGPFWHCTFAPTASDGHQPLRMVFQRF